MTEEIWEVPEGWQWSTLGKLCQVNQRDPTLRNIPDDLPVSFVPMAAVDAGLGRIATPQVRPLGEVRKGFTPFANGDVIFARITPSMENGKAAIARRLENGLGFGSTEFHVLKPGRGVLPEWVFFFIRRQAFRNEAKANFSGTAGQLRVPDRFMRDAPIPFAPITDQNRIVEQIESLFAQSRTARAALEHVPALLRRFRQAVLAAAFRGELTERDPKDEPAAVLLEHIGDEWRQNKKHQGTKDNENTLEQPKAQTLDAHELKGMPAGWAWTTIGQLAAVATGATPLRSKAAYYQGGTIPWVTSGALNDDPVAVAEEMITELALRETNAKVFPKGTILVAMYGEGQTRGRVSELGIDAATNQACAALLFSGLGSVCKPFVKLFIQRNYDAIRSLSSGGVQPNLNLSMIRQTRMPLAPVGEQRRIVERIEALLARVDVIEQAVGAAQRQAEEVDQTVLARAFRGDL